MSAQIAGTAERDADSPDASRQPIATKRAWVTPTCEQLPILTGLWLQVPTGSPIGGGGGPGGTVFPHH